MVGDGFIKVAEDCEGVMRRKKGTEECSKVANVVVSGLGVGAFFGEEHAVLLGGDFGISGVFASLTGLISGDEGVESLVSSTESNAGPTTVRVRMGRRDAAERGASEKL